MRMFEPLWPEREASKVAVWKDAYLLARPAVLQQSIARRLCAAAIDS